MQELSNCPEPTVLEKPLNRGAARSRGDAWQTLPFTTVKVDRTHHPPLKGKKRMRQNSYIDLMKQLSKTNRERKMYPEHVCEKDSCWVQPVSNSRQTTNKKKRMILHRRKKKLNFRYTGRRNFRRIKKLNFRYTGRGNFTKSTEVWLPRYGKRNFARLLICSKSKFQRH